MRSAIMMIAAVALAACAQEEAKAPEAEAPSTVRSQVRMQAMEMRPVFAYQRLVEHLATQSQTCTGPRGSEARGTVPDNVDPASIYGPFAGADAYVVQCGEQLTTVRPSPAERWLVVFPDGPEVQVVNCADARGADQCATREIPTIAPPPAE